MRYSLMLLLATVTLAFACDNETSPTEPDGSSRDLATGDLARPDAQKPDMPPPFSGDKIDLLFVIDKSGSMEQEQENLAAQFPGLIEALRAPKYGGEGCSDQALDKCNIPDIHIGVISTDMGAGDTSVQSCAELNGDDGKLQNEARVAGCTPPTDPWISFKEGTTNIPAGSGDGVQDVKDAFSCIAKIGTLGCSFEAQLESARRALDPDANVNPGFIRPDAMLAVVFITDEDDCSAVKTELFDITDTDLGPFTSFRCTAYGLTCDQDLQEVGVKTNCEPGLDWLHKVDDYAPFFTQLKPPGGLILAAIAGPTEPVEVLKEDDLFSLKESCKTPAAGTAVPAIRIRALVEHPALVQQGHQGLFNPGGVNICSPNFLPAMKLLGEAIAAKLEG